MTVMTSSRVYRRRLDVASFALLIVGIVAGLLSYVAITEHGTNPLALVPSVVASTLGASNLTFREATEERVRSR